MRSYSIDFASAVINAAWVYRFTRLDGEVLRITSAFESIVIGVETFTPLPGCQIYDVKHFLGGEVASTQLDFAHSVNGVIDTLDLNRGLWDGATVQIYPVDRTTPVLEDPLFTGTVQPVMIGPIGQRASFDCRGLSANAETVIQTRSPMCRTDLGSVVCGVDMDAIKHTGTVNAVVDRFTITVAGLASPPVDGKFNQGVGVNDTTGKSFLISSWTLSGLSLKTYLPICHLFTAGDSLTLYPGCNKTLEAGGCADYSNQINFQGEPHFRGPTAMLEG